MTDTPSKVRGPRIIMHPRDLSGAVIDDRYELMEVLGEGAMGVVFRAQQRSVGRDVALKVLKIDMLNEEDVGRFEREVEIVAALSHQNIIQLFDSGRDPRYDVFYIAMEIVEGGSLDDLLFRRRLHLPMALEIIYQVCGALSEPHLKGIVHRDIKPDNLLLGLTTDQRLQCKLVDFGIARLARGDMKLTATGIVLGTPLYMAPELGVGGEIDGRSDLYAVGVLLYEMLTGNPPYLAPTPMGVLLKHINEPVPDIVELIPGGFPYPEVKALLEDLMAKDINDRPTGTREVRQRIDAIREQYNIREPRFEPGGDVIEELQRLSFSLDDLDQYFRAGDIVESTLLLEDSLPIEQLEEETREEVPALAVGMARPPLNTLAPPPSASAERRAPHSAPPVIAKDPALPNASSGEVNSPRQAEHPPGDGARSDLGKTNEMLAALAPSKVPQIVGIVLFVVLALGAGIWWISQDRSSLENKPQDDNAAATTGSAAESHNSVRGGVADANNADATTSEASVGETLPGLGSTTGSTLEATSKEGVEAKDDSKDQTNKGAEAKEEKADRPSRKRRRQRRTRRRNRRSSEKVQGMDWLKNH